MYQGIFYNYNKIVLRIVTFSQLFSVGSSPIIHHTITEIETSFHVHLFRNLFELSKPRKACIIYEISTTALKLNVSRIVSYRIQHP